MVEIRVAADEAPAPVTARRSPSTRIRAEIRVRSEGESLPVVAVIDAVQSWLADDGVASAELSIGRLLVHGRPMAGTVRSGKWPWRACAITAPVGCEAIGS